MPHPVSLHTITSDGLVELGLVERGSVSLGREPENEIVVDSTKVSRRHCGVAECGSQWVLLDFESTNGTWLNGLQLAAGQLKILRNGDIIQLADVKVQVEIHGEQEATTSLLVFDGENFIAEYPLSPAGSRLAVGDPEGIPLKAVDEAVCFISLNGHHVEIDVQPGAPPVLVSGAAVHGLSALVDRDGIDVGENHLLLNFPAGSSRSRMPVPKPTPAIATDIKTAAAAFNDSFDREWNSEAGRRKQVDGRRFVFGAGIEEGQENQESDPAMGKFEMGVSQRLPTMGDDEENEGSREFQRIVLLLGGVLFFLLVAVLAYFITLL